MTDVEMPQMGESIVEGTLTRWLKKPGDKVERDEPLFEISTDKVDTEIPSPEAGVLSEVLVQEGTTVAIKTIVARIGDGARRVPRQQQNRLPRRHRLPKPRKLLRLLPPHRRHRLRRMLVRRRARREWKRRRGLRRKLLLLTGSAACAAGSSRPGGWMRKSRDRFRRWCARWRGSTTSTCRR